MDINGLLLLPTRPTVIAATLGSTGARAGVPNLAANLLLVDGFELDGENFLLSHMTPRVVTLMCHWVPRDLS